MPERKEHYQSAVEILAKFDAENIPEAVVPNIDQAAQLAIAYALLAINTQLTRLGNEISANRMALQAIANRPR